MAGSNGTQALIERVVSVLGEPEKTLPGGQQLSPRQAAVVRLAVQGLTRRQTALVLGVREHTVAGFRRQVTEVTGLTAGQWAPFVLKTLAGLLNGGGDGYRRR